MVDETDQLADLYAELGELAIRHTGSLERRAGAGTVIAFGLAVVHADEAERAVEAALEARSLVERHAKKRGLALEVTCVIHGGTVIVEPGTATFSPLGDTLELPVRIAAAIASNKIVVSERIHRLVRTSVELRALPAIRIKGQASAVALYEVTSTNVRRGHPSSRSRALRSRGVMRRCARSSTQSMARHARCTSLASPASVSRVCSKRSSARWRLDHAT